MFVRPPKLPWHSGPKSPDNPIPGRNQWIVVDFGGETELSTVRMTQPQRAKGEWDGSEIQNFELQTAPSLDGPWTAVYKGKGKKVKTPQDFPCRCTTRFFRLFAFDEYGYKFITLNTLDFKGFMKFDPQDVGCSVPLTYPPADKGRGDKKYNDKKGKRGGGGGGNKRNGGKGGRGRPEEMDLRDMKAATGRPKEELRSLLSELVEGAVPSLYFNDLLPFEREVMKELAWELGFLTEVLTNVTDGEGSQGGAAEAQSPRTPGGRVETQTFRVFRKTSSGAWLLPARDPRVAFCITLLTQHMEDWSEQHEIMEDGASVEVWMLGDVPVYSAGEEELDDDELQARIASYRVAKVAAPQEGFSFDDRTDDGGAVSDGSEGSDDGSGGTTIMELRAEKKRIGKGVVGKLKLYGPNFEGGEKDVPLGYDWQDKYVPMIFNAEATISKVQGEMNKLTKENFDKLSTKIVNYISVSVALMRSMDGDEILLDYLVDHLVKREYKQGSFTVELCSRIKGQIDSAVERCLVETVADFKLAADSVPAVRPILGEFEEGFNAFEAEDRADDEALARRFLRCFLNSAGESFSDKPTVEEQLEGVRRRDDPTYEGNKRRHHAHGLMNFIADMYLHPKQLLKLTRLSFVINQLYGESCEPQLWDVERLLTLLQAVGKKLSTSKLADDRMAAQSAFERLKTVSDKCRALFPRQGDVSQGVRLEMLTSQVNDRPRLCILAVMPTSLL